MRRKDLPEVPVLPYHGCRFLIPEIQKNDFPAVWEKGGLSSSLYDELVKWGYVIPEELDEDVLLRAIYVDSISDPRLQITILPTEQCNFRCKYCYESFPDKVMSEETQSALLLPVCC